ncbi:MAG: alpha/beta hydrolase [Rickettsiales bacterium]|jgi:pimeloyl-ACP methyl ester carboxylesterase|nr:alpha/beta hydrolase [Rickettsiales bacterium]
MFSTKLNSKDDSKIRVIFIHGWGNTHKNILLLASKFANQTENYAVDLMGFGESKKLEKPYFTSDYSNDVIDFIKTLPPKKTIIIGHSHGGRIAVDIAASRYNCIDGIVLLGGAGIPIKHSIFFKTYLFFIKKFAFLKNRFPFLLKIVGSKDYRNTSGVTRETFKNIIADDMTEKSKTVKIPTLLLYGSHDTETPIYIGEEYKKNIKNSEIHILQGANHWDLLSGEINRIHYFIIKFIREHFYVS